MGPCAGLVDLEKRKIGIPAGIRPARSLVTVLTELLRNDDYNEDVIIMIIIILFYPKI